MLVSQYAFSSLTTGFKFTKTLTKYTGRFIRMAAKTEVVKEERKLSKAQQKRLEQYQKLGNTSKAKVDKQKFDQRYASLYQRSFSRRKRLTELSMYDQFCEILSIRASKTLNPSNFLDYLASVITVYIGQNQTVAISKLTSNTPSIHRHRPLSITNVDMLIPYFAPRDKITLKMPPTTTTQQHHQRALQSKPQREHKSNDDADDEDEGDEEEKQPEVEQAVATPQKEETMSINALYAFAALPDQRLFADNKCSPYILDDTFRWTIISDTNCKPPRLSNKPAGFQKIVGAAILSDGADHTYCVYGTRAGLFYNDTMTGKPVKIIDKMVDALFRQNDYLFALCHGPVLYNISLTTKNAAIAVNEVFRTKRTYNVYTLYSSFIGGYYDQEHERLILGTNNAQIFVFENNGLLDSKFNDRWSKFRSKQIAQSQQNEVKLEKGNCLYFDVDRECVVYVGTKHVWKVSLLKGKGGGYSRFDDRFAKCFDMKWFLKGITYDCNHWMYIYHQKTLAILKRVQSSAACPYVLQIFTGKSLRFE